MSFKLETLEEINPLIEQEVRTCVARLEARAASCAARGNHEAEKIFLDWARRVKAVLRDAEALDL